MNVIERNKAEEGWMDGWVWVREPEDSQQLVQLRFTTKWRGATDVLPGPQRIVFHFCVDACDRPDIYRCVMLGLGLGLELGIGERG